MKNLAGKLSVKPENKRYEELREKLTFGINLAIQRMIELGLWSCRIVNKYKLFYGK